MASTIGFVGTLMVETRGTSRVWFGLTESADNSTWVRIGRVRAWFTMNLDTADRPMHMAQVRILSDAMTHGRAVKVDHDGAETGLKFNSPRDSFEVTGLRVLREPMSF